MREDFIKCNASFSRDYPFRSLPSLSPSMYVIHRRQRERETHSVKTLREGQSTVLFFLKFEPFVENFWLSALHMRRSGGNIFVGLTLFVLLYNTNFMNKPEGSVQQDFLPPIYFIIRACLGHRLMG